MARGVLGRSGAEGKQGMGRAILTMALAAALGVAAGGCAGPAGDEPDGGGDGDADADSDGDGDGGAPLVTAVDLLFVVGTTGGAETDIQALLGEEFRALAEELIWPTPDEDNETAPALTDLHVGLVTSDLDEPEYGGAYCSYANDARLLHLGVSEGCQADYVAEGCDDDACPWLAFDGGPPADGTPIWEDFACISGRPEEGSFCSGWAPLEAALGAVTWRMGPGQPNDGFLRDEALLAVVFVHARDDCSVADDAFFDLVEERSRRDLACIEHEELLHPVARYYDRLTALKDHPGHVVMAALVGVPLDGSWSPGDPIDDLVELRDRTMGGVPTCETPVARAYAPVRFAELAELFGENASLASICEEDWSEAMLDMAALIQGHLGNP